MTNNLVNNMYLKFKLSHITFLKNHEIILQNLEIADHLRFFISVKLKKAYEESKIKSQLLSVIGCINEVTELIVQKNVIDVMYDLKKIFECSDSYSIEHLRMYIHDKMDEYDIAIDKDSLECVLDHCVEQSQKDFPIIFDDIINKLNDQFTDFESQIDVIIDIILDKTTSDIYKLAQITQFIATRRVRQGDKTTKRKFTEID